MQDKMPSETAVEAVKAQRVRPALIRLVGVLCALVFLVPGAFGVSARASTEPAAESVSGTSSADETFGVRMTISFTDDDMVGHTAGDFASCQFRIRDGEGRYLTAELVPETGIYHITGTASDEAGATIFQGGQVPDDPTLLLIQGLQEGSYTMMNCGTAPEFSLWRSTVSVELSSDRVKLNGKPQDTADGILSFFVVFSHGFDLPCSCGNLIWCTRCGFNPGFVLVLALLFLAVGLVAAIWKLRRFPHEDPPAW